MNKQGRIDWGGVVLIFLGIVVGLIAIFFMGIYLFYVFTSGNETITIEEKWVKYNGDDAKYLISSINGQVFQITDSLIHTRWDSSNAYAKLKEGQTCEIKTQGFRLGILSYYKNIIEVKCK